MRLCLATLLTSDLFQERRLASVQETLKVLRPGGQALIYVWALEQERQNIKSNYLSDCRIKHKEEAMAQDRGSATSSYLQTGPNDGIPSNAELCASLETTQLEETGSSLEPTCHAKGSDASKAAESTASSFSSEDLHSLKDAPEEKLSNKSSEHSVDTLTLHVNRTHFESQDLLVPWHLRDKQKVAKKKMENSGEPVFHRYYHVFQESELEELVLKAGRVKVIKSYYDKGNWCIILSKD